MFPGFLGESLAGRALAESKWSLQATDIRMHAHDKHKTVDDTPFGGGAGMVMRADVLENALLSIPAEKRGVVLYPSPRGPRLTQNRATALAAEPAITFVCGRYEGVDQRFLDAHNIQEISIGDYVLSGGEPAALVIMDAIIRLLPGVMGNDETVAEESFTGLLADMVEYPHYTRPSLWRDAHGVDRPVPPVLQSGDHAKIRSWRMAQAQDLTQKRRDTI